MILEQSPAADWATVSNPNLSMAQGVERLNASASSLRALIGAVGAEAVLALCASWSPPAVIDQSSVFPRIEFDSSSSRVSRSSLSNEEMAIDLLDAKFDVRMTPVRQLKMKVHVKSVKRGVLKPYTPEQA